MKGEMILSGEKFSISLEDVKDDLFLSHLGAEITEVRCEGRKIYPLHYKVDVFVEEYRAAERAEFADEWRGDRGYTQKRFLSPAEYIAMVFEGIHVYTTVDGGKTKLLLTPHHG